MTQSVNKFDYSTYTYMKCKSQSIYMHNTGWNVFIDGFSRLCKKVWADCPIISGRWHKMKKNSFLIKETFGTQKILDVQKDLGEKISRMLESISGSFEFHAALEYSLPALEFWALWENSDARKFWSFESFIQPEHIGHLIKVDANFSFFFPKTLLGTLEKAWHSKFF